MIPQSKDRVRQFAEALFSENFIEPNPIYGTAAQPQLGASPFRPTVTQYLKTAESLRTGEEENARQSLCPHNAPQTLASLLKRDENLYRLRKEILTQPVLLSEAACRLWLNEPQAEDGLQALLEIVATAKKRDETDDDLLPTRLHYFVLSARWSSCMPASAMPSPARRRACVLCLPEE